MNQEVTGQHPEPRCEVLSAALCVLLQHPEVTETKCVTSKARGRGQRVRGDGGVQHRAGQVVSKAMPVKVLQVAGREWAGLKVMEAKGRSLPGGEAVVPGVRCRDNRA